MEQPLRIAMRMDNLYKYDTEVNCKLQDDSSIAPIFLLNNGSNFDCALTGGYSVALLQEIVKGFNFSLQLISGIDPNNFANDLRNKIDIYVGCKILREDIVKQGNTAISYPIGYSKLTIFLNNEHEANTTNIICQFHYLWFGFLLIITFNIIALIIVQHIILRSDNGKEKSNISIGFLIFDGISSALQKGTLLLQKHTTSNSIRLILLSMSIYCFILLAMYSGTIVAILSIPIYKVTSLNALTKSDYDVLIHRSQNTSLQLTLNEMSKDVPVIAQILKMAEKSNLKFESFDKTVTLIQKKALAWLTWDDTGQYAVNNVFHGLPITWSDLPVKDIKYPWTFYMRKNSSLERHVNKLFLQMSQSGLMKYHQIKWIPQTRQRQIDISTRKKISSIDIKNIYPTLIIVILGLAMSLIILTIERLACKYIRQN